VNVGLTRIVIPRVADKTRDVLPRDGRRTIRGRTGELTSPWHRGRSVNTYRGRLGRSYNHCRNTSYGRLSNDNHYG